MSAKLLTLDPARIFHWHCAVIAALVAAHVPVALLDVLAGHDRLGGFAVLVDLRREGNVPTFVSALALCALAVVAAALARLAARDGARRDRVLWAGVAAAFLFAAVDEAARLHETVAAPLRRAFDASGALYFAWVVPYALAFAALGVLAWPSLRALGRPAKRLVVAGAVLAASGALGCEMLQGLLWTRLGAAASRTGANLVLATGEEILELVGVAVMLRGLLTGLAVRLGGTRVAVALAGVEDAEGAERACMPRRVG